MINVSKRFPGVLALDRVSMRIEVSEVHALLGENGAGKSTLGKILFGVYAPDEGVIKVRGREVRIPSPRHAMKLGIAMVSQRPQLVEDLTVWENLVLGLGKDLRRDLYRTIDEVSRELGIELDLDKPVWSLSYTEKQMVSLVKSLAVNPCLLIMDEVTTYLPNNVRSRLYEFVKKFVENGRSVLFITHRIREALEIADRVTVLRKGRVVATYNRGVDIDSVRRAMFGDRYWNGFGTHEKTVALGNMVLTVSSLTVLGDHGEEKVRGVSFDVREGEILAITGIAGNGQRELAEALIGLRRVARGRITFMGIDITRYPPSKRVSMGMGFVPDDVAKMSVSLEMNVYENMALRLGTTRFDALAKVFESYVHEIPVYTPSPKVPLKVLSGGNLQKIAIIKELASQCKLLIACNPTRMLDEASAHRVRNVLRNVAKRGAVIVFTEDVEEALGLGTRIAVMNRGTIFGPYHREEIDVAKIEELMVS